MGVAVEMVADEPDGPARRIVAGEQPSLEAQLANLADEMAYNAHDIDDGLRSGLLGMAQLIEVPLFAAHRAAALAEHPHLQEAAERRLLAETLRRLLSAQVADVIAATSVNLRLARTARRCTPCARLAATGAVHAGNARAGHGAEALSVRVACTGTRKSRTRPCSAREVVRTLFAAYADSPQQLPDEHRLAHEQIGLRAVADYIAGMTDRFASREYLRLTGQHWPSRVQ